MKKQTVVTKTAANKKHPYHIGKNYFIRTVTHYYTGRLIAVYPMELVVEQTAWIADTGRFGVALEKGTMNEIEPFPEGEVVIGRGAIIDASIYNLALPRDVK